MGDMDSAAAVAKKTYIDLFAGCGGLSLGLHAAGWNGLFAVERDGMAFETLRQNFLSDSAPYRSFTQWPDWLPQEAQAIDALLTGKLRAQLRGMRGEVTLIAGGPPCQGFSVGGIRDGSDARNLLVHKMLDVVDLVRPPLVLVENVEGFARRFVSKPGETSSSPAEQVVQALSSLGYRAGYFVVDSSRFGVPQLRRRVLILGMRKGLAPKGEIGFALEQALERIRVPMLHELGLPVERAVSVWEALHDLASKRHVTWPDSPKYKSGTYLMPRSQYARLMRREMPSTDIPNCHRFSHHGPEISALYADAHKTQPPGRLSKAYLLSWGTKKDKKVLLDQSSPASTITTHPDEFIHYSEPRNVTVREMARIQSFPDDFWFYGRYTINGPRRRHDVARCSQVGNAVPPLLGRAVGSALLELLMPTEAFHEAKRTSQAIPPQLELPALA